MRKLAVLLFVAACAARPLDVPELPMPTPRCVAKPVPTRAPVDMTGMSATSADDGLIYTGSGHSFYAYDPTTAAFAPLSHVKGGLYGEPALAAIGGTIYAVTNTQLFAYDIASGMWTEKSPPRASYAGNAPAAVGANGKLYVRSAGAFGGETGAYDPSTDTWTTLAALTATDATYQPSAFLDGKLYSFGLSTSVYDPSLDRWTALAWAPHARQFAAGAVLGDKLYLTGGEGYPDGGENLPVDVFTPEQSAWTTAMAAPVVTIGAHAASGCNGQLYVFGGNGVDEKFDVVQSYDPATDTWQASP